MEQVAKTENKAKDYIAVTIGPIFDTMSLVSTPAALWMSSYMFSYITKTICELLLEADVKEEDIITPYFSKTMSTDFLDRKDGVGLFHDHVIFVANDFDIKSFNKIKEKALEIISGLFELDLKYLTDYIQIYAVKYKAENPIFGCQNILNSRELEKPFVATDPEQPLLSLLFPKRSSANEEIKKLAKKLGVYENWQLSDGTNIKDMNAIIKTKENSNLKKYEYYAIVRSDGDNISQIIASLDTDEDFRSFSQACLSYCAAIADEVARFGGVTIYAGGDDLLAILPCENKDGDTPFEFIKSANKIFDEQFNSYGKPTALSFGISMCYKKFPLYEALDDSAHLLFDVAKNKNYKNCSAIRLQKHSGQSEGLLIPNKSLDAFLSLKRTVVNSRLSVQPTSKVATIPTAEQSETEEKNDKPSENERIIVSVLHKLSNSKHLLNAVDDGCDKTITLFKNMFDAKEQKTTFLHETLPIFYYELKTNTSILALTDDGLQSDPVTSVEYILRMLKFFNEKAGGKE